MLVRDGPGAHAGRDERAHARARVRRRRLALTATPPTSRTSPTSGSTASDSASDPLAITPEPASPRVRYADPASRRRRAPDLRARDPGEGEPVNELVALPIDGRARRRCSPRARLLRLPTIEPRGHALLHLLGPPEHALGRDRAVGRAARRPRSGRAVAGGRRSRSGSRSGTPGPPQLGLRSQRLVEPLPRASSAARSSATISAAAVRARSPLSGGKEMAPTRACPPPP